VLIAWLLSLLFKEGKFPNRYKRASVTPLLKKEGLACDVLVNYRPISNLHTVSKMVERLFLMYLVAHVKNSSNYSRLQSAYKPIHSCETSLLKLLNDVYCATDNGLHTMLFQLDSSAAFDMTYISILLRRLRYPFSVSGSALNWIASYLVGRKQSVRVGHHHSASRECAFGVPQGSVVGPILFILYISPINNVVGSVGIDCVQYADDMQLYVGLED
jgi:Reverse transcriptase (RNA-dependent DNA polymerase)